MICFVYLSSAASEVSAGELAEILTVSRRNNAAVGLTGALCHYDGSFLQFLEGDDGAVDSTFARIRRDRRHRQILPVFKQEISQRAFGDWSMGIVKPQALGPDAARFCRRLEEVEMGADASHKRLIEGFLQTFRAWLR